MSCITRYCVLRHGNAISANGVEHVSDALPAEFADALYERLRLSYPRFYKMDNQCKLGYLASEILLADGALARYTSDDVAVVFSNANGSHDADVNFNASVNTSPSPSLFVYTLPNIVTGEVCIRHKLKGENAFFVRPRFDAFFLCDYIELMLQSSGMKACIGGWVEVADAGYDVLLYLVEKEPQPAAVDHNEIELLKIYNS